MANLGDWDREVETLTDAQLDEHIKAFKTILAWPFLKKAYDGYGLPVVLSVLECEVQRRQWKAEKAATIPRRVTT